MFTDFNTDRVYQDYYNDPIGTLTEDLTPLAIIAPFGSAARTIIRNPASTPTSPHLRPARDPANPINAPPHAPGTRTPSAATPAATNPNPPKTTPELSPATRGLAAQRGDDNPATPTTTRDSPKVADGTSDRGGPGDPDNSVVPATSMASLTQAMNGRRVMPTERLATVLGLTPAQLATLIANTTGYRLLGDPTNLHATAIHRTRDIPANSEMRYRGDDSDRPTQRDEPASQPPLGGNPDDPLIEHYKLSPEANERVFRERIVPARLTAASPRERPDAVFLIGQPGAGKTKLGAALAEGFGKRGGHIDVDSDLYKPYHPRFKEIMSTNDQMMAVYTRHDGRVWMAKVQDYVRQNKLNAVIQETLQNPDYFVQMMQAYREAGFRIRAAVMGVPQGLSRQGILARYYEQIARKGSGRLTVAESAALSYRSIVEGMRRIDESRLADEVGVYRRGEVQPRYHDELTNDGAWSSGSGGLRDALERERNRPLTPAETTQFRAAQQWLREVVRPEHHDELAKIEELLARLIGAGSE